MTKLECDIWHWKADDNEESISIQDSNGDVQFYFVHKCYVDYDNFAVSVEIIYYAPDRCEVEIPTISTPRPRIALKRDVFILKEQI